MKKLWVTIFSAGFLGLATYAVASPQSQSTSRPTAAEPQPSLQPVATGRERIAPGKQTVVIHRGSENVPLDNYFAELVIARMTDDKSDPEKLMHKAVLLVRGTKDRDEWSVFLGRGLLGPAREPPSLIENSFRVQKVLSSTVREQVSVQIDGSSYSLKPGEVLLVLG
jgi:hypothetical protein